MLGVKQVGLLAAGCQPWNRNICSTGGERFAYCATLAIYIYQFDQEFNEFKLHSIMSEHKKTITSLSWHPHNSNLIASASSEQRLCIWNISEQQIVLNKEDLTAVPICIEWYPHEDSALCYTSIKGPLCIWKYRAVSETVSSVKDTDNFASNITLFHWHHKQLGKIAFGHIDGSVTLLSRGKKGYRHVFQPENSDGDSNAIIDLQWDPLSELYLLIANKQLGIRLIDSEAVSVIMLFTLPGAMTSVQAVIWMPEAPGMFLSGDADTGVMRIWNVSRSLPLESLKLKHRGFHSLLLFKSPINNAANSINKSPIPHISSTSASPGLSGNFNQIFAIPQARIVCTFSDGGIGIYNLTQRKWDFLRDLGHIETIFDCKFKPDNSDHLATASFDGTIKVWDVNTFTAISSSPGNEGIIYSVSWAPSDLNCIAASTSKNGVLIWDLTKDKIIKRFTEHGQCCVYTVAWNHKDPRLIASVGADGHCVIRQADGKTIQKYRHPDVVFGCDWNPFNKDLIATCGADKNLRVFYTSSSSDQAYKIFSGHEAKVFQVKWSPHKDSLLCSSSDDCSIRIWDYMQESCINILIAHSAPVRGLLWNPEIPYLLISGSWDYTIRVWDIRDGTCLDTILDHGADVYGLSSHPQRPFIFASCSRDSTVRIWSLAPLVSPLELNIIAKRPWTEILSHPENGLRKDVPPLLCGTISHDLKYQLDKLQMNQYARTLRWFSEFFIPPGGATNLWEIVAVITGNEPSHIANIYKKGIMHIKHLTKYKASEAQELEIIKLARFGAGIGAPSREDRLKEAASIHILLGNVQRYCEIMIELGEWEKALSLAPSVSMEYWQSLTKRKAKTLLEENNDMVIPYLVALGDVENLVNFHLNRGQLQEAFLETTAASEGKIKMPYILPTPYENGTNEQDNTKLLQKTSEMLADCYFRNGSPTLAACCHLAVDDHQKAMSKLIRGNELELAVSMGTVLNTVPNLTHLALEYLSRRCERLGKCLPPFDYRDLALDLLKLIPESELLQAALCSRCSGNIPELDDLHERANLPSVEMCLSKGESAKSEGNDFECTKYFLLSTTPQLGLVAGLDFVKRKMSNEDWTLDSVLDIVQLMGSIRVDKLQQHDCAKYRNSLLIISAYIGALLAIRREYKSIVHILFEHARFLMQREAYDLPLTCELVQRELETWKSYQRKSTVENLTSDQKNIWESMVRKIGQDNSPVETGPDSVSSSHLPSHSDVQLSIFTNTRIQGPAFFLEDGRSAISINDALMWAKVNIFSPLGSGMKINPF